MSLAISCFPLYATAMDSLCLRMHSNEIALRSPGVHSFPFSFIFFLLLDRDVSKKKGTPDDAIFSHKIRLLTMDSPDGTSRASASTLYNQKNVGKITITHEADRERNFKKHHGTFSSADAPNDGGNWRREENIFVNLSNPYASPSSLRPGIIRLQNVTSTLTATRVNNSQVTLDTMLAVIRNSGSITDEHGRRKNADRYPDSSKSKNKDRKDRIDHYDAGWSREERSLDHIHHSSAVHDSRRQEVETLTMMIKGNNSIGKKNIRSRDQHPDHQRSNKDQNEHRQMPTAGIIRNNRNTASSKEGGVSERRRIKFQNTSCTNDVLDQMICFSHDNHHWKTPPLWKGTYLNLCKGYFVHHIQSHTGIS